MPLRKAGEGRADVFRRLVLLSVTNLQAGYGQLQVLWDVSLNVDQGEFVALIGSNGAGKTTTLRTIAGLIRCLDGQVTFLDQNITGKPPHLISRAGLVFITEELNLFEAMTVRDNLLLGAYSSTDRKKVRINLEQVFDLFPILKDRQKQLSGTLSGGERRMLAIGRGMMAKPRLLMVDEPSLGLAPIVVVDVFNALKSLHQLGMTLLLVEQNVNHTLQITDKAYVMEHGRIVLHGSSAELLNNEYLSETYLGRR
jgi:branched-chain amino acid transport system ATP-binding protein